MSRGRSDFGAIFRVLRNRNFAVYVAGNGISLTGLWVQRLTVGWLAWQLTRSGFWLGAVAFADLFPVVLAGPIAGVFADRLDRLKLFMVCQILATLQAVVLALLVFFDLITIELLFALTLVGGAISGLNQPARLTLTPSLVPARELGVAVSFNAIVFNTSRFIGPAIAGILLAVEGPGSAFLYNAVSYFGMIAALVVLRRRLPVHVPTRSSLSMFGQMAEGIRYTARHPGIGPILLGVIAGAVFARPVVELLPGLADLQFGGGAAELATLTSATGIGAILGGFWVAQRNGVEGLVRVVLICAFCYGLGEVVFVWTENFAVGVVLMGLIGFVMSIAGIGMQTLVQVSVDEALRGRVMSLYGMIFRGGPAIGALVMGAVGDLVGLRWPIAAGGVIAMGIILMLARKRHVLARELESPHAAPGE